MTNRKYSTSLYVASVPAGMAGLPRAEVRKSLWKHFKVFSDEKGLATIEEDWIQWIVYKNINVSFKVMDMPTDKLYILSFQPTGKNIEKWGKSRTNEVACGVLEFCDLLGAEISIPFGDLLFKRVKLSDQDSIDISNWEVICPLSHPATKSSLGDFLRETGQTRYENIFLAIPKKNEFHIFTQSFLKGVEPFPQLRNILSGFGLVKGPRSLTTAKEFAEKLADRVKEKSIFVFLEKAGLLENWYENLKIYFDSNHIPTQFIDEDTVRSKLPRFAGVRANLLLEMMTKIGKPPIILQAPEEIFINDGFLCLSDVMSASQRLFGALFAYSKHKVDLDEEVQIYDDIRFETPTKFSLEMTDDTIDLLAGKIHKLIGRRLKIDILLTKRWKEENIEKLIANLHESKIETERVYYISSRTSRFVDEYLQDSSNYRSCRYPYKILGEKTAFLKTCTETRIFNNLFSIYIELMWPEGALIAQGDLEKILWLTKKRIYRIQEFHILKNAEPVWIFGNLRKMYLGKIKERLTIPLRLLI
ncbi:MAG: hypothetical protein NWE90_04905 [Candidatus Bathyarchaeota archaeon]|nr:hypothetical protein [Candidatus Bathyarchaeota archaeon]